VLGHQCLEAGAVDGLAVRFVLTNPEPAVAAGA